MFVSRTEPKIAVPVSEGTVFTVQSPAAQQRDIILENTDPSNTMTYRYQQSNDNVTYTDVASNTTLAPGARVRTTLSGAIFYRLRASGNLNIAVKIDSEMAFTGVFSFINI